MKIQTLGTGLLYQVHRSRQRMIENMERKATFMLLAAITVCIAIIVWELL